MQISPVSYNSYTPYKYGKYNNSCSFTAKSPVRIGVLKNADDVSCIYCGEKMLTFAEIDEYSNKVSRLRGKKLYRYLSILEQKMKKHEKEVTKVIKEWVKNYPELQLHDVLQKMFPVYIEKLENRQQAILTKIANTATDFEEEDKTLIYDFIEKELEKIKQNSIEEHFKMGQLKKEFYDLKPNFSNKKDFEKILEIIDSMPNTHTNVDAFVIKYSRKSSKEIMTRLLEPSQATIEHLKPVSHGGGNEMSNIVLACKDCNSKRSNKPLRTMIGLQRNLPKFLISLLRFVEMNFPKQDIRCFRREYAEGVKATISEELSKETDLPEPD